MANYTCGATLEVAVGGDAENFPVIFPIYFGPTVSMTSSSAEWTCDAVLAVTASPTAALTRALVADAHQVVDTFFQTQAGHAFTADAALAVRTFDIPFPYTFPFVFDQAPVTMSFGKAIQTTQTATVSRTGGVSRGQPLNSLMPVTVGLTAALLQGFEQLFSSTLSVSATATASMTRNAGVDVNLDVVSFPYRFPYTLPFTFWEPASVAWDAHLKARLRVVVETTTAMIWDGGLVAPLSITAAPTAVISLGQSIEASLPVITHFPITVGQGHKIDVGQDVIVEPLGSVGIGFSTGAFLSITVITDVTTPDFTTWWPFFNLS